MKPLNQFQDYLVHEFVDDYNDGLMPRRDMIRRVLRICGGTAAAATMLTSLGVRAADALAPAKVMAQATANSPLSVAEDDPAITGADVTFPSQADGFEMNAYQVMPAGETAPAASPAVVGQATPVPGDGGLPPLVLVCHENRGLTEHIRDVTRRFAKVGYAAIAVDLVSREGGTAANAEGDVPGILSDGDPERHVEAFQSALVYAGTLDGVDASRVGMVGFCFGGGITWRCTVSIPELKATVPFYGPPPELAGVPQIKAAVLGVYSEDPTDFANKGRDELDAALTDAGVTHQFNIYPGTEHAFNNDTGPRYNEEQALVAWADTLSWLAEHV